MIGGLVSFALAVGKAALANKAAFEAGVPFTYIPESPGETLARKLQKNVDRQFAEKYKGQPVEVLRRSDQMRTDYATQDTLGAAGDLEGAGFSQAATRAPAARIAEESQDLGAQSAAAWTGEKLFTEAYSNKMQHAEERRKVLEAEQMMELAAKMQNKAVRDEAAQRVKEAYAGIVSAGIGAMGGIGGGAASTSESQVPSYTLQQPSYTGGPGTGMETSWFRPSSANYGWSFTPSGAGYNSPRPVYWNF